MKWYNCTSFLSLLFVKVNFYRYCYFRNHVCWSLFKSHTQVTHEQEETISSISTRLSSYDKRGRDAKYNAPSSLSLNGVRINTEDERNEKKGGKRTWNDNETRSWHTRNGNRKDWKHRPLFFLTLMKLRQFKNVKAGKREESGNVLEVTKRASTDGTQRTGPPEARVNWVPLDKCLNTKGYIIETWGLFFFSISGVFSLSVQKVKLCNPNLINL